MQQNAPTQWQMLSCVDINLKVSVAQYVVTKALGTLFCERALQQVHPQTHRQAFTN